MMEMVRYAKIQMQILGMHFVPNHGVLRGSQYVQFINYYRSKGDDG
jgi:hypothetical protein